MLSTVVVIIQPSPAVFYLLLIPILILLMQFRPEGLLGNRELTDVFPKLKRLVSFGKRD